MKKLVILVVAAVAVAAIGAAVLAAANLRMLVAAHRDELIARAERAIRRPLRVRDVEPSWLPPGIRLVDVLLEDDPRFGAPPLLAAREVRIVVRLLALVQGRVEVARVVLMRPEIRLARDKEGRWNVASLGDRGADRGLDGVTRRRSRGKSRLRIPLEWVVAVASGEIRDGRIEIDDRATGGRRFTLHRVGLSARDVRLGATARLRIDAALFGEKRTDTRFDLQVDRLGENDFEHTPFVARVEVHDAGLGAIAAVAGLSGDYAGRLHRAAADLGGTLARFSVMLEARTRAQQLRLDGLTVPPVAATLRARATYEGAAFSVEETSLTAGSLGLAASGRLAVRPWSADAQVRSVAGTGIALAITEPPIWLSDLAAGVAIDREGTRIESARVSLNGVPVAFAGRVASFSPLAGSVQLQAEPFAGSLAATAELADNGWAKVRAEASALDLASLAPLLAPGSTGRVEGRADATVALGFSISGEAKSGSVTGEGKLSLSECRLRDVNVVEMLLDDVLGSRLGPRLLSQRVRARYPQIFATGDTILHRATIPFTIADRRVASERVAATADAYEIIAAGWIDFDRRIEMQGDMVLSQVLSAALVSDVRAAKYLTGDAGRVTVPLRMRGLLGEARPEPDQRRLRARGLQALIEGSHKRQAERTTDSRGDEKRRGLAERVERQVIDRLERMLQP